MIEPFIEALELEDFVTCQAMVDDPETEFDDINHCFTRAVDMGQQSIARSLVGRLTGFNDPPVVEQCRNLGWMTIAKLLDSKSFFSWENRPRPALISGSPPPPKKEERVLPAYIRILF